MKSYKEIAEALKGKQHKIDKNKNGQIDAHDFKLLRKEESEQVELDEISSQLAGRYYQKAAQDQINKKGLKGALKDTKSKRAEGMNRALDRVLKKEEVKESEERMARSDYKVSPSGRKSHKEIVFSTGTEKEDDEKEGMKEAAPPGFEGTVKAMKKKKEIDNPYALAWSMYKKGYKSHKNADGTMKEEEKKQTPPPFDGPYKKVSGTVTDKSGAKHTPMSNVRHLARMAMKKQMKEEAEQIDETIKTTHEDPLVTVHDKDGLHTHANLSVANNIFGTKVKHTEVHAGAVNTKNREGKPLKFAISKHHAQAVKDEEKFKKQFGEQAPVAPVPGDKWKSHAVMVNGKQRVVVDRKNVKNYPEHEGWKEVSPGMKLKEDEDVKFSYAEIMLMLEVEFDKSGRYVHRGTYGSEFAKREREKDEKGFDADDKPLTVSTQKRGRGRPAGSKSGARGPRIK
jgi:hypothetical protein